MFMVFMIAPDGAALKTDCDRRGGFLELLLNFNVRSHKYWSRDN